MDLATEIFGLTRSKLIQDQLELLKNATNDVLLQIFNESYEKNKGYRCRGVGWDQYELPTLHEILECTSGTELSVFFRLFCENYNHWDSGLPDLLLWKKDEVVSGTSSGPKRGNIKLVEVKGPRDRLSEKQRGWLDQLILGNVDVEVCYVGKGKSTSPKSESQDDMSLDSQCDET